MDPLPVLRRQRRSASYATTVTEPTDFDVIIPRTRTQQIRDCIIKYFIRPNTTPNEEHLVLSFLPLRFHDDDLENQFRIHLASRQFARALVVAFFGMFVRFLFIPRWGATDDTTEAANLIIFVVTMTFYLTLFSCPFIKYTKRHLELCVYCTEIAACVAYTSIVVSFLLFLPTKPFFGMTHQTISLFVVVSLNLVMQTRTRLSSIITLGLVIAYNATYLYNLVLEYAISARMVPGGINAAVVVLLTICAIIARFMNELQERLDFYESLLESAQTSALESRLAERKTSPVTNSLEDALTALARAEVILTRAKTRADRRKGFELLRQSMTAIAHSESNQSKDPFKMELLGLMGYSVDTSQATEMSISHLRSLQSTISTSSVTIDLDHECKKQLGRRWEWDALKYITSEPTCQLAHIALHLMTQCHARNGSRATFHIFVTTLQDSYFDNPYHNFLHAINVAHATICLLQLLSVHTSILFGSWDMATVVVAALAHDVGHPGRNNGFFINTTDPLALTYNDRSVLENFHCSALFHILRLPSHNVFSPCSTATFRLIRSRIIELILATDVYNHFEIISRSRIRRSSGDYSYLTNPDDLWLTLQLCLKAADLSHTALPWEQHLEWSVRVAEEFYYQGDEEMNRSDGIYSVLFDRSAHDRNFARSQFDFLSFVAEPLFDELECVGEMDELEVCAVLKSNKTRWQKLAEEESVVPFKTSGGMDSNVEALRMLRQSFEI